ncbi:MAG: DNA internalization-related competence protein ComEC/Rec2 [Betaproteobacteria bacterium]|nr:DNA internalization-related competence protein ComEC/Rec2 [Betaproteobacteria bacterium]
MRTFCLAFVAGTALVQQAASLPSPRIAGLALAAGLAFVLVRAPWGRLALLALAGVAAGVGLAAWRAEVRLDDELPRAWEGRDIAIEGVVSGLPQETDRGTRFLFDPASVATEGATVPSRLSLTVYAGRGAEPGEAMPPPAIRAGERWAFTVRLKRPRGLANPHAFDFEPWALARGIRATGYVRPAPAAARLADHDPGWPQSLHRLRGDIRESMRERLGEARFTGVLVALAVGDQDAIGAEDWRVFWRTGVGHLVSISGLHVTLFASLAFAFVRFAWVRVPALALRVPARKAGAVAGVAAALAYCLLSGYAVPAQRTVLMLAVAALALLAGRHGSASRVLALAVLAVLLADPWAVLSPGFWLSFGAVAAILYALALRAGAPGALAAGLVTQAAVTLALAPMLVSLFGELSLVSPLANAFAIPVVSLVVVPLTLAGSLAGVPGLLEAAHALMEATMVPLEWLAAWPGAVRESADAPFVPFAAALAGAFVLLAPRGVPLRFAGFVLALPLACFTPPAPPPGAAWLDVLDVGQGLAAVVRTASHTLVYDTGPAWTDDSDSGGRIVAPFLRGEGIRSLDGVVVTHADDDHAGGAASVARARNPRWLLSTLAEGDARHATFAESRRCLAGLAWDWDGVRFEILHPDAMALADPRRRENDRACVLRVRAGGATALLASDIEKLAESELLARDAPGLRARVLLVPHHGSRTSSTPAFVAAVAPEIAVISAGWRNRFRHPSPAVLQRYASLGIRVLRTDLDGAVRVELPAGPEALVVTREADKARYWSDRLPNDPRSP